MNRTKSTLPVIIIAIICSVTMIFSQNNLWKQTQGPHGGTIRAILVEDSTNVLVSTGGWMFGGVPYIYRSTNSGDSWLEYSAKKLNEFSLWKLKRLSNKDIFAASSQGVYRSKDNGYSWEKATNQMGTNYDIAISSTGRIFATCLEDNYQGIIFSDDKGKTWKHSEIDSITIYAIDISSVGDVFAVGQRWRDNKVKFLHSEDNGLSWQEKDFELRAALPAMVLKVDMIGNIFVSCWGENLTLRSSDNGETWDKLYERLSPFSSLAVTSTNKLYAGTSNGLYESTDNGITWSQNNSLPQHDLFPAIEVNSRGQVFVSAYSKLYRSDDNGETWKKIGVPNSTVRCITISQQGTILATTFRSTDKGNTWKTMDDLTMPAFTSNYAEDIHGNLFFGCGTGLYRSTDQGGTWSLFSLEGVWVHKIVYNPMSGNIITFGNVTNHSTQSFRVYPNGEWTSINMIPGTSSLVSNSRGEIFSGTPGGVGIEASGIYKSSDDGNSWVKIFTPDFSFQSDHYEGITLAINPANNDIYGVTLRHGMFSSRDNGISWLKVTIPLKPQEQPDGIPSLVINSQGHIFVGTKGELLCSRTNGKTWFPISNDIPFNFFRALAVDAEGYLYTGPQDGGVYRTRVSTSPNISTEGVFRSFNATPSLSEKAKKLKFKKGVLQSQPNLASAAEALFTKLGKNGATFLGVPQTQTSLKKQYAWVQYKKASELGKLFTQTHTGVAYPLDYQRNGTTTIKKLANAIKPSRSAFNNVAWEQLVLLKMNILASKKGITPAGFGDLELNVQSSLCGKNLFEQPLSFISNYVDSLMTYYNTRGMNNDNAYAELNTFITTVIKPINEEFAAELTMSNYELDALGVMSGKEAYPMVLKGVQYADSVRLVKYVPGKVKQNKDIVENTPTEFSLEQNYPNPFNPTTTLSFVIGHWSFVTLKVYDVLGREVATLLKNEAMEEGEHEVEFDASALTSGMYFYRLTTGTFSETRKMLLIK
ncbi:MAG: T9SS type A sorting domain-containing protein [Ignavibacteriales bacterium]|nr:T9SS type A sorting domain-containing protein [Ignavibacteriales bacterium]